MTWEILEGDVRKVCRTLEAESFDALIADPPYGLSFMGKRWDYRVPNAMTWAEVLRVLKPGAFAIMFGGTRTYHRLVCAIEDGGFWPVDQLDWLYGQGFAKTSVDVAKAIQKKQGVKPLRIEPAHGVGFMREGGDWNETKNRWSMPEPDGIAAVWGGYGTALKPAHEPALLCCKPSPLTIAETALQYGVGGLAIDASRVGSEERFLAPAGNKGDEAVPVGPINVTGYKGKMVHGRWPANVVLQHAPGCQPTGEFRRVKNGTAVKHRGVGAGDGHTFGIGKPPGTPDAGHGEQDVEVWDCADDCPVRLIDQQSGHTRSQPFRENTAEGAVLPLRKRTAGGYSDEGGASRYFKVLPPDDCRFRYQAKVARGERDRGLEDVDDVVVGDDSAAHGQPRRDGKRGTPVKNDHPTLKPLALVRYFARMLLVPPHQDGRPRRLLVPFCGSGSEVIGALQAGWDHVVGIELDPRHAEKARKRIARGRIIQHC